MKAKVVINCCLLLNTISFFYQVEMNTIKERMIMVSLPILAWRLLIDILAKFNK